MSYNQHLLIETEYPDGEAYADVLLPEHNVIKFPNHRYGPTVTVKRIDTAEDQRDFIHDQMRVARDNPAWAAIGRYLARNRLLD